MPIPPPPPMPFPVGYWLRGDCMLGPAGGPVLLKPLLRAPSRAWPCAQRATRGSAESSAHTHLRHASVLNGGVGRPHAFVLPQRAWAALIEARPWHEGKRRRAATTISLIRCRAMPTFSAGPITVIARVSDPAEAGFVQLRTARPAAASMSPRVQGRCLPPHLEPRRASPACTKGARSVSRKALACVATLLLRCALA